jgi:hypothetical protein
MLPAIIELANTLAIDTRPIFFSSILDRPGGYPVARHMHALGDGVGFESLSYALERLHMTQEVIGAVDVDNYYRYAENALSGLSDGIEAMVTSEINDHKVDSSAHLQYALRSNVSFLLAPIRKPVNVVPSINQGSVALDATFQLGRYYSLYRLAQSSFEFQVSTDPTFASNIVQDITANGAVSSYHLTNVLDSNKTYYWRGRYTDAEGNVSDWSDATSFTTQAVTVSQPTITSPTGGASTNTKTPTIAASAFAIAGATDTEQSADWEVWTGANGTGTLVFSSYNDTNNKTSITLTDVLTRNTAYYPRVRYTGVKYGRSPWSTGASFLATWAVGPTVIGTPYGGGYYAGLVKIGDQNYYVIVAPRSTQSSRPLLANALTYSEGVSEVDSVANTTAMASIIDSAAAWVKTLTINGYSDWQIPSKAVLEIIYRNLKPTTDSSDTTSGDNPYSVPPSSNYGVLQPSRTASALFQSTGSEAFAGQYWSSSTLFYTTTQTYTTPPQPIYQTQQTVASHPHGRGFFGDYAGQPQSAYSFLPPLGCDDTPGTSMSNVTYTYFPDYAGDGIPYWFTSWDCPEYGTTQVIIGYTPGSSYNVTVNNNTAWSQEFTNGSQNGFTTVSATFNVRPVRLVPVLA